MTNDQMKPNRFARWAQAKKRLAWVNEQFSNGKEVMIITATRGTVYNAKHAGMFKATKSGFYVQQGKSFVCLDFTKMVSQ